MSLIKNCFMGILSCDKYQDRRSSQDLTNCIFDYMYFIGNPTLDQPIVEDNVVILPCGDNYEDLPIKTKLMLKWVLDNKPDIEYVFKTDDDIKFDFTKLFENFSEISLNKMDYSGRLVINNGYESSYHQGKCESDINDKIIYVDKADYCSGGGYFLSKRSAEIIINTEIGENVVYEDHFVGKTLSDNSIFPQNINLHNISCFW